MAGVEEFLTSWLVTLSQHPIHLYFGIVLILFASSFGLPFPEEIVLITSGMVAYMALAEATESGLAPTMSPYTIATVCFLAVIISDTLVFALGRRYGLVLLRRGPLKKLLSESNLAKVEKWTHNYGTWACGIFRFTPGLRFPGHFMCGALGISYVRFLSVDGMAALLSVPTQVLLIAFYGDQIMVYFKTFKVFLIAAAAAALIIWIIIKRRQKQDPPDNIGSPNAAA
jgi:membrane protein DedA with SNARE-associated domain